MFKFLLYVGDIILMAETNEQLTEEKIKVENAYKHKQEKEKRMGKRRCGFVIFNTINVYRLIQNNKKLILYEIIRMYYIRELLLKLLQPYFVLTSYEHFR